LDEGILDIKSPAGRVFISGGYETDNAQNLPYFNISVHKKED